jgi:CheY-like chemotaxis protein/two-component sensor histidine kinase
LRLDTLEPALHGQAMGVLDRQVNQLAHLVDDLLEVSRAITGRIQLHLERLDLRDIVNHAVASARPLIDRRKHTLEVALPSEPIWVQADPTRLEQVVVNLLSNAAKYTDEGGKIWLTVKGQNNVPRAVQSEQDEVVLQIRDSGAGITPELLPHIFDLFTQADRTLDRSQGGLGIGLSLVQRLVTLHHGTVEAVSGGVGQGSEFTVRLPMLPPEKEVSVPPEITSQTATALRVLVVDDNSDAATMLIMMLQMFGHGAKAAYSAQTALKTAAEYAPDCIVLDIGLPDMNGYEVAQHLRQLPQTKDVWLIAMTGYGQDSDRQRSLEAGFDHHLVKPVDPQHLQNLLLTLAKEAKSAKRV